MANLDHKRRNLSLRKARVRSKVAGTSERPRLTVLISGSNVSAQLIDDDKQQTLAAATTIGTSQTGSRTVKAAFVGSEIAKKAKAKKIKFATLDRNGRLYAKRLSSLADAARKEGLEI